MHEQVSISIDQQFRGADCVIELQTLQWKAEDYIRLCQDTCKFSLTLGVAHGHDHGYWRIAGSPRVEEMGHCGAVEANREVDVRLSPGIKHSVICSVSADRFCNMTKVESGWLEPQFLARLRANDSGPRAALAAMARELSAPGLARDIAIEGQSLILISEVARLIDGVGPSVVTGGLSEAQFRRVEDMVHAQIAGPLSIAALAKELGFSRRHLSRTFKTNAGLTLRQFVEEVRLRRVIMLLEQTNLPLKVIANMVGISSANYLSTAFRRRMGLAPAAYRQQMRPRGETH